MKKVLLGAGMLVMLLCAGFESKAGIKIGSISIKVEYERGIKEWNSDHTATFCVGKGICRLVVGIDFGMSLFMGTDDKGKLLLLVPLESARKYSGDFVDGGTYPVEELDLTPAMVEKLGFPNGYHVRKAQYPVTLDNSGKYYCIQLQ